MKSGMRKIIEPAYKCGSTTDCVSVRKMSHMGHSRPERDQQQPRHVRCAPKAEVESGYRDGVCGTADANAGVEQSRVGGLPTR